MKLISCKTCKNHKKINDEVCYCQHLHYYPNEIIIKIFGCHDYKKSFEQLDIFESLKEGGKA